MCIHIHVGLHSLCCCYSNPVLASLPLLPPPPAKSKDNDCQTFFVSFSLYVQSSPSCCACACMGCHEHNANNCVPCNVHTFIKGTKTTLHIFTIIFSKTPLSVKLCSYIVVEKHLLSTWGSVSPWEGPRVTKALQCKNKYYSAKAIYKHIIPSAWSNLVNSRSCNGYSTRHILS